MEFQKRLPFSEKAVSEIEPEKDIRVRILGKVVDMTEDSFILDDGTGRVQVTTDPEIGMEYIRVNDSAKVIGRVFASESGFELRAEAVQNASGVDVPLYKKLIELERNTGL
jgi:uncharacterized protein YdeI (BOF family)